jgi:short-subunit dehydrogenase
MLPKETALITGASSGLGLELAELFAAEGCDLVLVARRKERLEILAQRLEAAHPIQAKVLAEDLSRPEAPQLIYQQLEEEGIVVNGLVNNAGFGALGAVAELGVQRQADMVEVNTTTLTKLTRLFLPGMIERDHGRILNIASTAAFQPGPRMAVYYATKAFVLSFTEGLAEELSQTRIKVSCLCPGPTRTSFGRVSGMDQSAVFRWGAMDAKQVARAGYRGLNKSRVVVIPGFRNKLGTWVVRFTPRGLTRKVMKRVNS